MVYRKKNDVQKDEWYEVRQRIYLLFGGWSNNMMPHEYECRKLVNRVTTIVTAWCIVSIIFFALYSENICILSYSWAKIAKKMNKYTLHRALLQYHTTFCSVFYFHIHLNLYNFPCVIVPLPFIMVVKKSEITVQWQRWQWKRDTV